MITQKMPAMPKAMVNANQLETLKKWPIESRTVHLKSP